MNCNSIIPPIYSIIISCQTVIDLYTRECLGICVGQNLRSTEVAEMLNSIALRRPLPQLLKTDDGSEFGKRPARAVWS